MMIFSCIKFPILVLARGPVEEYTNSVNIADLTGVYLNYVVASTYKHIKNVWLVLDVSLKPCAVEVETVDGKLVKNWTLEYLDYSEFRGFAEALGINVDPAGKIADLARTVLSSMNKQVSVTVPALRYQSK